MSTTKPVHARGGEPGAVLFGKTRRLVLGWLLGHPDEEFYLRQIVRRTGASQGGVQRELAMLTKSGLIVRRADGRQVYYRADTESPIYPELRSLLAKTTGMTEVLRESLAPLADRIDLAFVFGSAARGELVRGSDIDLFVVGDVSFAEVAGALIGAQDRLGRDVNPTVYPSAEFRSKREDRHPFVTTVLNEPRLLVIGDPHEPEGLGKERLGEIAPSERVGDSGSSRSRAARPRRQRS